MERKGGSAQGRKRKQQQGGKLVVERSGGEGRAPVGRGDWEHFSVTY